MGMEETAENVVVRVLCPKLVITRNETELQWLIGSPFFPRFTIVSTLRCIHTSDSSSTPDYTKESEDIRTLLLKGFDVIGALIVGSSDPEETSRKAVNAGRQLRKLLCDEGNAGNEEIIGAVADSSTGGTRFFVSRSEKSTSIQSITSVVYEDQPEKYIWERGCLLRCELPIKFPVCIPVKNLSDAQSIFLHATEAVVAKFTDPQVTYIMERLNVVSSETLHTAIVRGRELDFNTDISNINLVGEKPAQNSNLRALRCTQFCSKGVTDPAAISAENADVIQVRVMLNRSEESKTFTAPIAEYVPALEEVRLLIVNFELEVICYAAKDVPLMYAVSRVIIPGLVEQLKSMRNAILPKLLTQHPQVQ
uniref:Ufm1-specific protease n=1 Tax=Rhizophora mucronata TaxID=61149 RepID=A0A2P2KFG9_RHIMU